MKKEEIYKEYKRAINFVCEKYFEVKDEDKVELFHTLHVGFKLVDFGYSGDVVLAGFLHDIFEETGVSAEELTGEFGEEVTKLVQLVTKEDNEKTWEEKNADIIRNCFNHGEQALALKAADILVNYDYYKKIDSEREVGRDEFMARTMLSYDLPDKSIFKAIKELT